MITDMENNIEGTDSSQRDRPRSQASVHIGGTGTSPSEVEGPQRCMFSLTKLLLLRY